MLPDSRVKTPIPAASWTRLATMSHLAAVAAVMALLSGCLSQPCDGADGCRALPDAGMKDTATPTSQRPIPGRPWTAPRKRRPFSCRPRQSAASSSPQPATPMRLCTRSP